MNRVRACVIGAGAIGVALVAAACGSGSGDSASTPSAATTVAAADSSISGKLSFVGIWTGPEQKNFRLVLDGFEKGWLPAGLPAVR